MNRPGCGPTVLLGRSMLDKDTSGNESSDSIDCPTCSDTFSSERAMKIHHSRLHGVSLKGTEVVCGHCGETYRSSRPERTKYCSKECTRKGKVKSATTDCLYCEKEFEVKPHEVEKRIYCSNDCKDKHQVGENHPRWKHTETKCDHCGESITVPSRNLEEYDTQFCDSDCMYAYQTGENHHNSNQVTKPCANCGTEITRCESHFRGRPLCSRSCYAEWLSDNWSGENHPLWARRKTECGHCGEELWRKAHQFDGRTHYCSYHCAAEGRRRPWSQSFLLSVRSALSGNRWMRTANNVRSRREHECQLCGETKPVSGMSHTVHHIVPVVAGGCNADELLMIVCSTCHPKIDAYTRAIPEVESLLLPDDTHWR
jgi:hypothetical protein